MRTNVFVAPSDRHIRQRIVMGIVGLLALLISACGTASVSPSPTPTATATPVPAAQKPVYVAAVSSSPGQARQSAVYALNAQSGALAWKATLADPLFGHYPLVVDSSRVYATTTSNTNKLLTAFEAASGQQLWSISASTQDITVLGESGGILVALEGNDTLAGFTATNGSRVWQAMVPRTFSFDTAIGGGNVYAYAPDPVSELYAFRISDGSALWHVSTDRTLDTFSASGAAVYATFMIPNNGHPLGGVIAYSANTGTKLWENTSSSQSFMGMAQNDAVYVMTGPFQSSAGNHIQALNTSDGSQLWLSDPAGSALFNQIETSDPETLYVLSAPPASSEATPPSGPVYLSALHLSSASSPPVLWQKTLSTFYGAVAGNHALYLMRDMTTIDALNTGDGSKIWTFQTSGTSIVQLLVGP